MNRQEKLTKLKNKKNLIIHITAPSDICSKHSARKMWGDNWVKHELIRAFRSLGATVVAARPDLNPPDILIHQSGGGIEYVYKKKIEQFPSQTYKIIWVYSHPEAVTNKSLQGYDEIFCCSLFFLEKLKKMGYQNAQVMLGATSKRPISTPKKYDIVFVGNNRGPYGKDGRKIINDLKSLGNLPYKISIWGANWKNKIPDAWYGGLYWDYPKLGNLYASAKVCLQDHRAEMSREGFVSVKLFDILGSGGFAISDKNIGIRGIFKGAVPEYESPKHLKELLDYYTNHPAERTAKIRLGQQTVFRCTWENRAKLFLREVGFGQ